jgi:hypothetical protein
MARRHSFIHSFINGSTAFRWALASSSGSYSFLHRPLDSLDGGISPSQDRYLHTEQHKHRINAHTDIDTLSGIRIQDPSVRGREDCSYLRPRGHRDRPPGV